MLALSQAVCLNSHIIPASSTNISGLTAFRVYQCDQGLAHFGGWYAWPEGSLEQRAHLTRKHGGGELPVPEISPSCWL